MDLHELDEFRLTEWPPEAGKEIRAVLVDQEADLEDRLLAAELARKHVAMSDDTAMAALEIVDDPIEPMSLRGAATGVLREVFGADLVDELDDYGLTKPVVRRVKSESRRLFEDPGTPDLVRRRILEAACGCGLDWHDEAVRTAFHSGDRDWRISAVRGMFLSTDFDDEVLEALQSDDRDLLLEAVEAVHGGLTEAWPYLRRILHDPDADFELLAETMMAVGEIRRYTLVDDLRHLLYGEDEALCHAAEWALLWAGYRGDPPSLFYGNGRPVREP